MQDKRQVQFIISAAILFIFVLYGIDQWFEVNYLLKSSIKVMMLFIIVVFYNRRFQRDIIGDSIKKFREGSRGKKMNYIGFLLILLIPLVYLCIRPNIDEAKIIYDFESKYEITKGNFLFYGIYLSLVNAMFEELFFRGFLFLELCKIKLRRFAYLFSASSFAIYHLANMVGWFNPFILGLALMALMAGGILFDYLDEKEQTFLNSYFLHFCADVGIVITGVIIFFDLFK